MRLGTDSLEIHQDAIAPNSRILIVDDLLATGGTAKATVELLNQCKAEIVGCAFVIELMALKGREKLSEIPIVNLIEY